jgi:hypothetical protein
MGSLIFHIAGCAIAQSGNSVVVVNAVHGGNACAAGNCASYCANNGTNRAASKRANSCAAQTTGYRAFGRIIVRIVVNTVLNVVIVIVCHDVHFSLISQLFSVFLWGH